MTRDEICTILGIDTLEDEKTVRNAYRRRLPECHPEEHPEGFRQLREAYEEALKTLLHTEDEQTEDIAAADNTPEKQWLSDVEQVYTHFSSRTDENAWKQLFKADFCVALDTAEAARTALLRFLMNSHQLPKEIWQLIDHEFTIREEQVYLSEQFPPDFIEYVCWSAENDGFIDYHLFTGDDAGDYDSFISLLYTLKGHVDQGENDAANALLEKASESGISHVFLTVEKLRMAISAGDTVQIKAYMATPIIRDCHNEYVRLACGRGCEVCQNMEMAKEIYDALLEENRSNYQAGLGHARCLMAAGAYKETRTWLLELLEISKNDPETEELLRSANRHVIEDCERAMAQLTPEDRIELGWCYIQNERYQDAVCLLKDISPDRSAGWWLDYNNLCGRVYIYMEKPEEALPYEKAWLEAIEQLPAEAHDTDTEKKRRRKGYACYCIGECLFQIDKAAMDKMDVALYYMDKAIASEKDVFMRLTYLSKKAEILNQVKRYTESVDICSEIIAEQREYLPAYILRQEAWFHLRNGQEVINDFREITRRYQGFDKSYIYAIQVYINYEQYEDAVRIAEEAEAAGCSQPEMLYWRAMCSFYMASEPSDYYKAAEALEALYPGEALEEKNMLPVNIVNCYMRAGDSKTAYVRAGAYLLDKPGHLTLSWMKADILYNQEDYQKALSAYKLLIDKGDEHTDVWISAGNCEMRLGHSMDALPYYQHVIEIDDHNKEANDCMLRIYQEMLSETEDISWMNKGLPYADRQLEIEPDAYGYIARGLLYQAGGVYEKAAGDYRRALEYEADSPYALNNLGNALSLLETYDEAVLILRRAIEVRREKGISEVRSVNNLAGIWLQTGEYASAEDILKQILHTENNLNSTLLYVNVLRRIGLYDRAEQLLKDGIADCKRLETRIHLTLEQARTAACFGDMHKAEKIFRTLYKENSSNFYVLRRYVTFLAVYRQDYRKIIKLLRALAPVHQERMYIYLHMFEAMAWFMMKKDRQAADCANEMLNEIERMGRDLFQGTAYAKRNRFAMGMFYLFSQQMERAAQCFDEIEKMPRCTDCQYGNCYELYIGRGFLSFMRGDTAEGCRYFEKVISICPECQNCRLYIEKRRIR